MTELQIAVFGEACGLAGLFLGARVVAGCYIAGRRVPAFTWFAIAVSLLPITLNAYWIWSNWT